jgi:hypothetical protein
MLLLKLSLLKTIEHYSFLLWSCTRSFHVAAPACFKLGLQPHCYCISETGSLQQLNEVKQGLFYDRECLKAISTILVQCRYPWASPRHFITQASLDLNPGFLAILRTLTSYLRQFRWLIRNSRLTTPRFVSNTLSSAN